MSPEFQTAILASVLTALGVAGALLKMLPGILERRERAFEDKMESQRKDEQAKRDNEAKELELKMAETRADNEILSAMSRNLEAATRALITTTERTSGFEQRIAASEHALSENTEALGIMADHFGELLTTGSKPLQKVLNIIERIDTQGTAPLNKLQSSVDEIKAILETEFTPTVAPAGTIISTLNRIEGEWQEIRLLLLGKMQEAVAEKRKTNPIPMVKETEPS